MLGETYIFFADIYFIQNLLMKIGVLWLTIKILKIPMIKPVIKIIVIASIGTIFEITGLFIIPSYNLLVGLIHVIEVPGMMLALLWKQKEYVWKGIVCGYFGVLMINGVIEILWNLIGLGWLYPMLVALGVALAALITCYVIMRLRMEKGIYPVDIYRPEIIWSAKGYYDSGNCLIDPYTGKGVHIISERLAKRLELEEDYKVCIPFQSLGEEEGLIDVYYVENVRIKKDTQWIELEKVPLGIAKEGLFQGKGYEMIINENVW